MALGDQMVRNLQKTLPTNFCGFFLTGDPPRLSALIVTLAGVNSEALGLKLPWSCLRHSSRVQLVIADKVILKVLFLGKGRYNDCKNI